MRNRFFIAILIGLAACTPAQNQPLPTQAQLPADSAATPTLENDADIPATEIPTVVDTGSAQAALAMSGALEGMLSQALLSVEVGSDYTLLFEQPDASSPVQLRLILAGNIEPGTYAIMPAVDFQRPEDALVAARFDLGFLADDLSGTFTLNSIGEDNFTGSLNLTARSAEGTLSVTGEFQNLNASIIG